MKWNAVFSKQWSCQYYYMDAPHRYWLSIWRKSLMAIAQECYELYWTNLGGNIPQNSSCTSTYHPSWKPSKLDKQYMRDTAGELIRDVLLWTPSHVWANVGRPARTYQQQLCTDTECSTEDLPRAMEDRDEWQERAREICANGPTCWWWRF